MYDIYTQAGEFNVETIDELLDLFDRYPFVEGNDFFTVGRAQTEYLEIFCVRGGFSLAVIPEGRDDSQPVDGKYDRPTVRRMLIAFCHGDKKWLTAPPSNDAPALSANAAPIRPSGCAVLIVAMALLALVLALGVS